MLSSISVTMFSLLEIVLETIYDAVVMIDVIAMLFIVGQMFAVICIRVVRMLFFGELTYEYDKEPAYVAPEPIPAVSAKTRNEPGYRANKGRAVPDAGGLD